jgi:hypothetical protein
MIDAEVVRGPTALGTTLDWARRHSWIGAWWLGGRALVILATTFTPRGVGTLSMWDGRWYQIVARDGYLLVPGRQSDPAFFPLFPILLRGGHALGLSYSVSAVAISTVAFLVALLAFHALTRELLGDTTARRATVYLAIFPFGYVFSMAYPESVVLAAMALAALAALRGHWPAAAVLAAAAALARPEAVFLSVPLATLAWRRRRELSQVERSLSFGAALAPIAAVTAFPIYLDRVLHDPLAWSRAERAWGRHFSVLGVFRTFEHLPHAYSSNAWVVRDVAATALYLVLLAAAARSGVPRPWLLAGLAVIALPLFSGAFDSIGRFGLLAPPTIWGLAWLGRRRKADHIIRVLSIALLIAASVTIPQVFP